VKVPVGLPAIVDTYGDPWQVMGADGHLSGSEALEWEKRLVFVPLPRPLQLAWGKVGQLVTRIRVHQLAAPAFEAAFRTLHSDDELWGHLKTFGGTYAFRPKRDDMEVLSTHSWGVAIDLNPKGNELGVTPSMHPAVVQAFEAAGFVWGGRWRRPDGMHFQLCGGY
jgi:hypothetical protein